MPAICATIIEPPTAKCTGESNGFSRPSSPSNNYARAYDDTSQRSSSRWCTPQGNQPNPKMKAELLSEAMMQISLDDDGIANGKRNGRINSKLNSNSESQSHSGRASSPRQLEDVANPDCIIPYAYKSFPCREQCQAAIIDISCNQLARCRSDTEAAYLELQASILETKNRQEQFERMKCNYYFAYGALQYYNESLTNEALDTGRLRRTIIIPGEDGDADMKCVYESDLIKGVSLLPTTAESRSMRSGSSMQDTSQCPSPVNSIRASSS